VLAGNSMSATGSTFPNGNPALGYNPPGVRHTDPVRPLRARGAVKHDYATDAPAPGSISFRWIHGSVIAAKNHDPRIQIVQYNEDTFILRQNVCVHWEAPFAYLLFGNAGALLIDTGATPDPSLYPLRETVDAVIARWARIRGRTRVPLTIVLTAPEDVAQHQGMGQFAGRPDTTIVPRPLAAMQAFYGFGATWPDGVGTIDLGDRIVTVIPTPGAHKDGLSLYDLYTGFLFTGDLLFPGKINIANDRDYIASLERLARWTGDHPVKWVMGGHVEMQFLPGKSYPRFATYKPWERVLQMEPMLIDEAIVASREIAGKPMMLIRPDFILFNRVSPDQRTDVWPAGVPNISPPRPF
jgi:glyoxylase-like metal-dependent hydrolase (beta-lactamase superfamily II)